jgi:chromosomal replication initiator protein
MTPSMNTWDRIKLRLSMKLKPEAYQNWVVRTELRDTSADRLIVAVPNQATKEMIEEDLGSEVEWAMRDLNMPLRRVVCVLDSRSENANGHSVESVSFSPASRSINPKFSFEAFVVGPCNQFAHAAAKAVASNPSTSYNPLFLYGAVGIGKTHLMHAIGKSLLENFSSKRVVYTSGERFMNEMISCVKNDRIGAFHQHYRSADVLLVDDVQVIGGKERTQDEFFYTFNDLYDHQKQIVISSDSSPKNIPGLVERLRSRFEWGLMVDIQPPDLETKMAILDKKAEAAGISLPEDVRIFLATRTKSNVRELEGSLIKLIAYSEVTGSLINMDMAQTVLRHLVPSAEKKPTIDSVLRAVAERFSVQPAQLRLKSNARHIAYPRQVAMYIAKDVTGASLPELGKAFGGKHHTTVLHSIQKIEKLRQKDSDLNRLIQSVVDSFA